MARGGGGGGRGGRSRGRRHHHGSTTVNWDMMSPMEKVAFVLFLGILLLLSAFTRMDGTGYDEGQLADFASSQYEQAFGQTECYEDNLLLLLVVYEDRSDFSYMTWVGDHIGETTFEYLRGEGTWLDDMLSRQLQPDYTYTLSGDLHGAIRELAQKIDSVTEYGSHTCSEDHSDSPTYVRNLSRMQLNEALLEDALAYFLQETRIPIVLVIAEAEDIFG